MKRRMVLGAMVLFLVLQAQMVFGADDHNDLGNAVKAGNFSKAEKILKSNAQKWNVSEQENCWLLLCLTNYNNATTMRTAQLLRQYNVAFGDCTIGFVQKGKSEEFYRYLIDIGMPFGSAVYVAIERGEPDNLIRLFIDKGAKAKSADLRLAAEKNRWVLVPLLIDRLNEDDMSYRLNRDEYTAWYNSQSADYKKYVPFSYDPIESKTALMFAAQAGQLRIVRLLVEHGAKVNLRAEGGETAASLAYNNGEIEIYNYLKGKGAIDYEPRQAAQQPTPSTTNVYVQPSAPAQASTSSSSEANVGKAIAEAFSSPIDSGTYSCAGTKAQIRLTSIAKSGMLTYTNNTGKTVTGTYNIDGNRMTIQAEGTTYVYTITSKTSFSGHNETWVRTGF
jgi:ankyrin repeat protein